MGQVMACCTVAEREANDDTINFPPPQEIGQPWIGKIKTNECKIVSAVDPKKKIDQERVKLWDQKYMCSTEEKIAQELPRTNENHI